MKILVDVSRYGCDETRVTVLKTGAVSKEVLPPLSCQETARRIRAIADEEKSKMYDPPNIPIVVKTTGVGVGVKDALKAMGFEVSDWPS